MTCHTTEQAFESTVESLLLDAGWRTGDLGEWDVERALFPARAVAFIRETQPASGRSMAGLHGDDVEPLIVAQLARELDLKGALDVLRHGFKFYGRTFRLAYFAPAHGLNPDALARFERNELTVTRQVPCHPGKGDTLDLVFALNGVPALVLEGIEFPYVHDLRRLRNLLPDGWPGGPSNIALQRLTEWGAESRYPGDWPELSTAAAAGAEADARAVYDSIATEFGRRGVAVE